RYFEEFERDTDPLAAARRETLCYVWRQDVAAERKIQLPQAPKVDLHGFWTITRGLAKHFNWVQEHAPTDWNCTLIMEHDLQDAEWKEIKTRYIIAWPSFLFIDRETKTYTVFRADEADLFETIRRGEDNDWKSH